MAVLLGSASASWREVTFQPGCICKSRNDWACSKLANDVLIQGDGLYMEGRGGEGGGTFCLQPDNSSHSKRVPTFPCNTRVYLGGHVSWCNFLLTFHKWMEVLDHVQHQYGSASNSPPTLTGVGHH